MGSIRKLSLSFGIALLFGACPSVHAAPCDPGALRNAPTFEFREVLKAKGVDLDAIRFKTFVKAPKTKGAMGYDLDVRIVLYYRDRVAGIMDAGVSHGQSLRRSAIGEIGLHPELQGRGFGSLMYLLAAKILYTEAKSSLSVTFHSEVSGMAQSLWKNMRKKGFVSREKDGTYVFSELELKSNPDIAALYRFYEARNSGTTLRKAKDLQAHYLYEWIYWEKTAPKEFDFD